VGLGRPQQLLFGIEVADKTVHAMRGALTVAAAMRPEPLNFSATYTKELVDAPERASRH